MALGAWFRNYAVRARIMEAIAHEIQHDPHCTRVSEQPPKRLAPGLRPLHELAGITYTRAVLSLNE